MFSIVHNLIIVFLVVFLKIDQGIYCPASDDYFTRLQNLRRPYRGVLSSFGQYNLARSNSVSRDNITERRQSPRQYSFSGIPNRFAVTYEVPIYAKTFRQILSMDQYNNFIQQNDYVIIYFSSKYNANNCQTTNNALWDLKTDPKYKDVQIYEVLKDYSKYIADSWYVESAPTLLLYRGGYNVGRAEGDNVSSKIKVEKVFKKLLRIEDKDEDTTTKASENTTKTEEPSKTYYNNGYKYTSDDKISCNRERVSSTTNGNETKELTEPKRNEFLYIITSLEQYKKYSQGIDYSIVFFCSQDTLDHKENCDAVKFILKILSNKRVYEKIKIFSVDIKDSEDVAKHFKIDSVPSLVSVCMENVTDTLGLENIQNGKADSQIESFFKSLLESKVRADWTNEPKKTDNIYNVINVEQYEKYCKNTERKIIFFFSPDEKEACEEVKTHLKTLIVDPIYSDIKIYGVDVKNKDLSKYFQTESAPTLKSFLQDKIIYSLGSFYVRQYTFVANMFSNLMTSYIMQEPVIKYSICGDCAPKTGASSTNQSDSNKVYNQSNLPPLKREGILLKVSNKEEYSAYVVKTELAVIDFSYEGCSGCVVAYSKLEKQMNEVKKNQEIIIYSVDIGECKEVAALYGVSSAPTLVFLHMGKEIEKFGAAKSQSELEIQKMFDKLLNLKSST